MLVFTVAYCTRPIVGWWMWKKWRNLALLPTVRRLKGQIQGARERAQTNPEKANESARKLLSHIRPLQKLFNQLFGEQDHFQKEFLDEAAAAVNYCIVAYQRKTGGQPDIRKSFWSRRCQ